MSEDHNVDQVAMVSRNPGGSAAQTPGYEVLEPDAAKEADVARGIDPGPGPDVGDVAELGPARRRAKPKGEKATAEPGGEDR